MHFYVIKFKTIKKVLLWTFILFIFYLGVLPTKSVAQVFLYADSRKVPIYCVDITEKAVALTFDAAWGSDKTKNILNVLKENDVKATFFLVGFWVDKNEELVQEINNLGFEIGTHSNTHPDLTKLSKEQINLELSVSKQKIENITKKRVFIFRAPFGAYNNLLIDIAENNGLKTIQWDVDSLDWKGISSSNIVNNVLKKAKCGSIILCHNNADNIVEALPSVILGLKSRGYKFKTVSELIFQKDFIIDNTGKQVKSK